MRERETKRVLNHKRYFLWFGYVVMRHPLLDWGKVREVPSGNPRRLNSFIKLLHLGFRKRRRTGPDRT